MLNIKETETLAFTYDQPFHIVAETQQVAHEPNRAIWENIATENCVLQLWVMTEPSEVQPISHQHSAMLIMVKYLLEFNVVVFLPCSHPKSTFNKDL